MWKRINSLIKPLGKSTIICELKIGNQLVSDSKKIAQVFNNFFVSSVEELASTFKDPSVELPLPNNVSANVFTLQQTNQTVVLAIIDKLTNSLSKDLFYLDTAFLKKTLW